MATIYMHQVCDECEDILGKLASEDHVSKQTELEMLISSEFKRREWIKKNGTFMKDLNEDHGILMNCTPMAGGIVSRENA